jgi:DNA polymerase I-like protein with 3'-5' exonuclease and polymerase domains
VLEVVDSKAEESRELLERIMIEAAEVVLTDIPAEADANVGKSWADK